MVVQPLAEHGMFDDDGLLVYFGDGAVRRRVWRKDRPARPSAPPYSCNSIFAHNVVALLSSSWVGCHVRFVGGKAKEAY